MTYRPELGVLYPSELATGMRIYVEYDRNNPNLVRVQNRNAMLAIIPAGSTAVVGWLIGAAHAGRSGAPGETLPDANTAETNVHLSFCLEVFSPVTRWSTMETHGQGGPSSTTCFKHFRRIVTSDVGRFQMSRNSSSQELQGFAVELRRLAYTMPAGHEDRLIHLSERMAARSRQNRRVDRAAPLIASAR